MTILTSSCESQITKTENYVDQRSEYATNFCQEFRI